MVGRELQLVNVGVIEVVERGDGKEGKKLADASSRRIMQRRKAWACLHLALEV